MVTVAFESLGVGFTFIHSATAVHGVQELSLEDMLEAPASSYLYPQFYNKDMPCPRGAYDGLEHVGSKSARLRAEVAEAQRHLMGSGRWADAVGVVHPVGNVGLMPHGPEHHCRYRLAGHGAGSCSASHLLHPVPAEALNVIAGERRHAAEIIALEDKLQLARRRHAAELARISVSGSAVASAAMSTPTRHVGEAPAGSSAAESGPMLVCRRRMFGGHAFRLWVEDRGALGGCARVHAADEETGGRTYTDVSDSMLSVMLAAYRESDPYDQGDDRDADVDEFLGALLDEAYFSLPARGNKLELRLPSKVLKAIPSQPQRVLQQQDCVENGALDSAPTQDAAASMPLYCPGVLWPDGQEAPLPQRSPTVPPAQAYQPSQTRRPPAAPMLSGSAGNAGPESKTLGHGTPCLQHGGPDGGGGRPFSQHGKPCAPRTEKGSCTGLGAGSSIGSNAALVSGPFFEVRPPSIHPPAAASASKPPHRRVLVRPQSAPHSSTAYSRSLGQRTPQSARRSLHDEAISCHTEEFRNWPPAADDCSARRPRRARPTSAKALKHRRVLDDGLDSIIYEDIEEEGEDEPIAWIRNAAASSTAEASVAREPSTGGAASERRAAQSRGSTGGCSSCSSIRGSFSVSSRSVSRSRRASARDCGGGGRSTSRTPSAAAESRSQEQRNPPTRRADRPGSARGPRPPAGGNAAVAALARAVAAARGEAEDEHASGQRGVATDHVDFGGTGSVASEVAPATMAPVGYTLRPPAERRPGAARPGGPRAGPTAGWQSPRAMAVAAPDVGGGCEGDVVEQQSAPLQSSVEPQAFGARMETNLPLPPNVAEAELDGRFDTIFEKYGAELTQALIAAAPTGCQPHPMPSAATRASAAAAAAAAASAAAAAIAPPRNECGRGSSCAVSASASLGTGPRASSPPPRRMGVGCCISVAESSGQSGAPF